MSTVEIGSEELAELRQQVRDLEVKLLLERDLVNRMVQRALPNGRGLDANVERLMDAVREVCKIEVHGDTRVSMVDLRAVRGLIEAVDGLGRGGL